MSQVYDIIPMISWPARGAVQPDMLARPPTARRRQRWAGGRAGVWGGDSQGTGAIVIPSRRGSRSAPPNPSAQIASLPRPSAKATPACSGPRNGGRPREARPGGGVREAAAGAIGGGRFPGCSHPPLPPLHPPPAPRTPASEAPFSCILRLSRRPQGPCPSPCARYLRARPEGGGRGQLRALPPPGN